MARTSKARKNETSFGSVEGLTFGEARYARSKLDRLMTPLVRTEILSSVDDEGISSVRSIQTTQRMKLNHPDSIPFERAVEARRYLKRV
ncbi:MAG: hypothetical protein NT076_03460, partial [Candidatus Pacearchaeota archaeon]|nr:hypothetical protein [Candidatus Pacearchaeota archaeon]